MNIPFSASRPLLPRVTLALLAALVLLAPYAMSFTPFSGVYTSGTYHAAHETDPLWGRRVFLVTFGLCAAVIPVFEICALFLLRRLNVPGILTGLSAWFACAVIGWRSFPWWVTGVYAAASGRVPWTDLDPKGLIPMTWLGELWRLPLLLLYPAALVAVPAGVAGSILLFRRRAGARFVIPAACAAVALVFLFGFSPGYGEWLMD